MMLSPHICMLCMLAGETGGHIMLPCPFSRSIWFHFLSSISLCWALSSCLLDLLREWHVPSPQLRGKKFWLAILHGICEVFGWNTKEEFFKAFLIPLMR